jgi:5-methyltetrahydrofolate--homocysteine methyltransferase
MGYNKGISLDDIQETLDSCERELLSVITPRYVYRLFDISHTPGGVEINGSGLTLTGQSIKEHLEGCDRLIVMAATLSSGADKLINKYQITDMSKALITDAMASAAIEQVCNLAEVEIKEAIQPEYMTWRFSPGYGDLPLDIQPKLLSLINAPKYIGLTHNSSNLLIPIKSVSAVIGISSSPIEQKRKGCAICNMNKTCQFRKRGEHCGF